MRIALDHQTFTLQRYGGISRYFARLAGELIASQQAVGIFAPFHQNGYLEDLPAGTVHGRRVDHYPRRTTRAFLALNRIAARPGLRRWRPDIIHETYYAHASSRLRGVPLVLTVYDMTHEVCRADFAPDDPTSEAKRRAVARADHIICISRSTQRDLIDIFGVDPNKTSAVLLGVDPPAATLEVVPSARGSVAGRPTLLFVGVRAGYKNFDGFLRAVATNPALRQEVDIVAFGGGALTAGEMELIQTLDLTARVRQVSGDDRALAAHYAAATALVYPSHYEGFGLPPLEAMAHDCPVVCSNTSSLPEVVQDAAETFDPDNEASMAQAIEAVIASDDRRRMLIERGRERVGTLTWAKCARETLGVYQALQGRR